MSRPNRSFEKAARAAASYLAAHAALVAAGVSEERPAVARRVADAWIALTGACAELPAGGPEQDRGAAALRPAGCPHVAPGKPKCCPDCCGCEDGLCCECHADRDAPKGFSPVPHAFVPHPWGKNICDAKVDDDGRSRTCTLPRGEHQS